MLPTLDGRTEAVSFLPWTIFFQLKPKTNKQGADILDFLLPEMENRRGSLVVVLCGYKKEMEELISYNEGERSKGRGC